MSSRKGMPLASARVDLAHAHGRAERGGLHENGITKLQFDGALGSIRIALPIMAMDGDPGDYGDFRDLQEALGDVLVHADRGAENACANKRQAGEIKQALNRAVLAKGAVHHGENDVNALAAAAAVQSD